MFQPVLATNSRKDSRIDCPVSPPKNSAMTNSEFRLASLNLYGSVQTNPRWQGFNCTLAYSHPPLGHYREDLRTFNVTNFDL